MNINSFRRRYMRPGGVFLPMVLAFFVIFSATSCKVTQPVGYFNTLMKKDTTIKGLVDDHMEMKIMAGDRLGISVSSLNPLEDALFNSTGVGTSLSQATSSVSSTSPMPTSSGGSTVGHLVQPDGTVLLHRLGNVNVAGMTLKELSLKLADSLTPYLKEPIVQVIFLNHKVTMLGDVLRPQVLSMPEEKLSLLDAIALSGDISVNANRDNITIIREDGDDRKVKHISLQDQSIFSSPWYYLQPNDVVVVSTDYDRATKDEKRQRMQTAISLGLSALSLIVILLSRFIK